MPRESKAQTRQRAAKIAALLKKRFPDARTELDFSSPLELLVATVLSAQCTDARVNQVSRDLFARYRSAADYAAADPESFQQQIKSTGFYRNKTKAILAMARRIADDFGGQVPDTMDGLLTLPGVARKTANVVLGNAFGRCEGVVVDTHVIRVSQRLRLTARKNNQGDKMEKDLMELVPRSDWSAFGSALVLLGRHICTARKPECPGCPINKLCPSAFKV